MDTTTLHDTLAIHQLYAKYSDAIMRNDAGAFASCWTDDALWLLLGQTHQGKQAILQAYSQSVAVTNFILHLALAPLIAIQGNTAKVRSQVVEILHLSGGGAMLLLGNYNDELQKTSGQWLFSARRIHLRYSGPFSMDDNAFLPLTPEADKPFAW